MTMKGKKITCAVIAIVLALALLACSILPALAADGDNSDPYDNTELEAEKEALEQEAADAQAMADATDEQIVQAQKKLDEMSAQIKDIDAQLADVTSKILSLNSQIQDNTEKLDQARTDLAQAQSDMKTYYEELKGRIQVMYEYDATSYLEVLLQSSSIADFFSRVEYISEMVSYDNEVMGKLDDAQRRIEKSKEAIEQTERELEKEKSEQEQVQASLEDLLSQKQAAYDELNSDQLARVLQKQQYEEQHDAIVAQISAVQAQIDENNAAAEASREAARKAAEEAARQAAEEAARDNENSEDTGGGSSDDSSEEDNTSSGSVSFHSPLDWYILTSGYGYRISPITGSYSFHGGLDLATNYGNPIYAAASGTVILADDSDTSYGYGIHVVIDHGDGYTTLYGHMSQLACSSGDYVEQGEIIGYVGSTGWSTGPHCHFEIMIYGSTVDPSLYI